ncbi:MAG: copper resistance protein NlpE [Alistipes sp.]
MKKVMILAAATLLFGCGGNRQKPVTTEVPDTHTAETSLDYLGRYTGTIPAADCPGIKLQLDLHPDGTYLLKSYYIERDSFVEQGRFRLDADTLALQALNEEPHYYKVAENSLSMLDQNKQVITGALADKYTLQKEN